MGSGQITGRRALGRAVTLWALLSLAGACGCRGQRRELLFHAGVGQRSSLNEIKTLFQRREPRTRVNFSYKGSGYFLADIARSREGDLFMPGEEFYLLQAAERGLLEGYDPRRDLAARFLTVILTPRGNPAGIRGVADFARPGVRVGLGNPRACAIGLWHEKIFKRAGIWQAVRKNATLSAKCIPELGNAAQHRLIDATIVWATTAVLYLRDCEILPLEPRLTGIVRLPVGLLKFSRQRAAALRLKSLILSGEGRAVFRSHAYLVDPVDTDALGFLRAATPATRGLLGQLRAAAAAVKGPAERLDRAAVGPLLQEVQRQRRTVRAGN